MENKIRLLGIFVLMLVGAVALSGIAYAVTATIEEVEIDGTSMEEVEQLDILRGEDIEVKVVINANENDLNGVQVEAFIRGYDHSDLIEDITDVFDMKANRTYVKKLKLHIPTRIDIDPDDEYTLVILAESREGVFDNLTKNINLGVSADRHLVDIKDIVLNPEREVQAGRALLTTVRIKNYGQKDEDGVKVGVSIPELGVSASDFVDEIEAEESTSSEELYMRIPECAEPGNYRVDVVVEYDDGDEEVRDFTSISVVEGDTCAPIVSTKPTSATPKTIITVGAETQDVVQGAGGVVYPITITNAGNAAKVYTVVADGADWASFRMSPTSTVLLQPGEAASVFVYVSAKTDAPLGQQMFAVTVSSAGEVLKQMPLKANVQATGVGVIGLKKGLEIGLIVLVVLLVILGLIIGFNKLRAEPEEESKTYY